MNKFLAVTSIALLGSTGIAIAQPAPDALPLSQILTTVEADNDIAYIKDVEWDSDGYWEIDYVGPDGREVEIRIDPLTGAPFQR